MLFQSVYAEKVASGEKTRTTRFRKHAMVKVGNTYKAKTQRFSKEHFALIKVVSIQSADFVPHSEFRRDAWIQDLQLTIGNWHASRQRHAEKEGFADWYDFRDAYIALNAHHRDDATRKHYIIDFGVVNTEGQFIRTKFAIGDWVSWERYGKQKTAQVLEIKYSEWNQGWCYKLNSWVNGVENFWDWEMEDKLFAALNPQID